MKAVFLDINGVMCPPNSSHDLREALPGRMEMLNEIAKAGAEIVLSSSHRLFHSEGEIRKIFAEAGFEGIVRGATPLGMERFREIQAFLDENPEIESFAILDDAEDMGPFSERLICTSPDGLSQDHVRAVLELLREKPSAEPQSRRRT